MRLFIALPLPDAVRAELAAVQQRLRQNTASVRWADPQGLHLTLQFLGATEAALVPHLLAVLQLIAPVALELRLNGLGVFPNPHAPRVIWAGIAGDTDGLIALHTAVVQATAPLGFSVEARPFQPHLTLGRTRSDISPEQRRHLGAALARADPPAALPWTSAGPQLYSSTLMPQGVVYDVLG